MFDLLTGMTVFEHFLFNTSEAPIIVGSLLAFIGMVMFAVILFGMTKDA